MATLSDNRREQWMRDFLNWMHPRDVSSIVGRIPRAASDEDNARFREFFDTIQIMVSIKSWALDPDVPHEEIRELARETSESLKKFGLSDNYIKMYLNFKG